MREDLGRESTPRHLGRQGAAQHGQPRRAILERGRPAPCSGPDHLVGPRVAGRALRWSAEAAAVKKARTEKMVEDRKPPKLIIRNLPWSVKTPEQLAELFRKFGKVKHSTLPKIKDDTQAGFGFVVMRGKKNAEKNI